MSVRNKLVRNIFVAMLLIFFVTSGLTLTFFIIQNLINNNGDENENNDEIIVYKPVIYIYPQETSRVSVSLSINGEITESDPEYNNGWTVVVNPDGKIEGGYDYLFYEAKLNYLEIPSEGWCIKYKLLENWMDETLEQLGLNKKESQEFKDFWLEFLPKANHFEIRLLSIKYLDSNIKLDINPQPDTIIRVLLIFSPLEDSIVLNNPIITTSIRSGFTVVEWGGFLL